MKKLLIIAILMLAMVFTVAACTTEPENNNDTEGDTTVAVVDETTAEPTPPETDPVETDPVETEPVETEPVETEAPKAAYPEIEGLVAYLPLDKKYGNKLDDVTVTRAGLLTFDAGYKGAALKLDNMGTLTLGDWQPNADSFTVGMWINSSTGSDPVLFGTQCWDSSSNPGLTVSFRGGDKDIRIAAGILGEDGSKIKWFDNDSIALPDDYAGRWMYVLITFDREAGEIRISFDFNEFQVLTLPEEHKTTSLNAPTDKNKVAVDSETNPFRIGSDGDGCYGNWSDTWIDEVMVFNDALTMEDLALIQAYYGFEKPAPVEPEQPAEPEVTAPRLAVDKTTYAVGESIMVTAVGSGTDWVGINTKERADNGEGSAFWWYIESVSGQAFDILAVVDGSGNTCTLPAGVYTIRLVANDADFGSRENWIYEIEITIE